MAVIPTFPQQYVIERTQYSFTTQSTLFQSVLDQFQAQGVRINACKYGDADSGYVLAKMVFGPHSDDDRATNDKALNILIGSGIIPAVGVAYQVLPVASSSWEAQSALCLVSLNAYRLVIDAVYSGEISSQIYAVQPAQQGRFALEQAVSVLLQTAR